MHHRFARELRQARDSETAVIAVVSTLIDVIDFLAIAQEFSGKAVTSSLRPELLLIQMSERHT
jgi:hypothetical protein